MQVAAGCECDRISIHAPRSVPFAAHHAVVGCLPFRPLSYRLFLLSSSLTPFSPLILQREAQCSHSSVALVDFAIQAGPTAILSFFRE